MIGTPTSGLLQSRFHWASVMPCRIPGPLISYAFTASLPPTAIRMNWLASLLIFGSSGTVLWSTERTGGPAALLIGSTFEVFPKNTIRKVTSPATRIAPANQGRGLMKRRELRAAAIALMSNREGEEFRNGGAIGSSARRETETGCAG